MERATPRFDETVSGPELPPVEQSLAAMLSDRARRWSARTAVKHRGRSGSWQELRWADLDRRRRAIAAGLLLRGVEPGDRVAFVSENSAEMLLAEVATLSLGAACAPIFPEYGAETLLHCLRQSGARVVCVGSAAQHAALPIRELGSRLQHVVVLDDAPAFGTGNAVTLGQLEQKGAGSADALASVDAATGEVGPEQLAYLLFTSGTTGRPKGVELTHRNILSQQAALAATWDVSEADVILAYLPWHHCFGALFERMTALSRGALFALDDSRGRSLDRLLENAKDIRPTVYFSVPRIYQSLLGRAQKSPASLEGFFHPGLRFVFTAAAPPSASTFKFFEERNVPIIEGWGLTETSPCVTMTPQRGPREHGVVGWPLPGTTVRLAPTMASDRPGVGEVLVRGAQVMRGYHHDPAATARVLVDGWLRTGDLGEWTPNGLRILGRADGVFKLENGEKVASGEVEARLLAASPLVEQALVVGSGQPNVTALVWLAPGAARAWADAEGLPVGTPEELAAMPELRLALTKTLQAANLLVPERHERVRRVALLHELPSLARDELTPTMKIIRTAVLQRHAALVAALQGRGQDSRILELSRRDE